MVSGMSPMWLPTASPGAKSRVFRFIHSALVTLCELKFPRASMRVHALGALVKQKQRNQALD